MLQKMMMMGRKSFGQKNTNKQFKTKETGIDCNMYIDNALCDAEVNQKNLVVNKMLFVLIFLRVK
jgi:hypothetical protein